MGREGFTVHGFRSSFRDWCSERAHAEREVAEAALSHATGNEVKRAYARSYLFDRRRALMDEWGHFCLSAIYRMETRSRRTKPNKTPWCMRSQLKWTSTSRCSGERSLRTGSVRPPDPCDRLTRRTSVAPADVAACPHWVRFLEEATGGDKEMIAFLRQWAGYCLTGDTREQALLFLTDRAGTARACS